MKTVLKLTALSAFLLMLAGGLVSCNRETPIPFTWISLAGTDPTCDYWGNLTFDNSVKIINSLEELENYIDCPENRFLDIDFSRYSLLIAVGETSGVFRSCGLPTGFVKKNGNTYILRVTVGISMIQVVGPWISFVLVPKISENAQITLETTYTTRRVSC